MDRVGALLVQAAHPVVGCQGWYRYPNWIDGAAAILQQHYPRAELLLTARGSMDLFIDFPGSTAVDMPADLEGFPSAQQHGYVASIDEDTSTVRIVLLGGSRSTVSGVPSQGSGTLLVQLDVKDPQKATYIQRVKQRAQQCTAPVAGGKWRCKNRTLAMLPDGRPRCYCHMSPDILDYMAIEPCAP